jgi:RimJ/RimL family protein N-acetyltransferase
MNVAFDTSVAPDMPQVREWLARLRLQKGLARAREALYMLRQHHPDNTGIEELQDWHAHQWWNPIHFGCVRLERRGPEHFDFVWRVILDREFANKLKYIPQNLTPRDLLHALTQDSISLIPDSRSIQWVVFKGDQPIGLSMFVNINFRNRTAEQIMGIMPPYDHSLLVGDVYCSSLLFAFNCLGMNKVQGLIYESNKQIAEQQQRLGFQREGVLKQAVWNEDTSCYDDLLQIALLEKDFSTNRILQRHIKRQSHDAHLTQRQEWPRYPMT